MRAPGQTPQLLLLLLTLLPATGECGRAPQARRGARIHHTADSAPPPAPFQAQSPYSASPSMRNPPANARASWGEVSVWKTAVSTLPMAFRSLAASFVTHAGEGEPGVQGHPELGSFLLWGFQG